MRRDPDVLIETYGRYAEYFARIAASRYLQQKIRLHTDTHLLSQAFADLCGLAFATAPIPFDQRLLLDALKARRPRGAGEPLTVAYLGDAREEKGYQHLPQALAYLWKDYVAPGRVRFVLQSNFNTPGGYIISQIAANRKAPRAGEGHTGTVFDRPGLSRGWCPVSAREYRSKRRARVRSQPRYGALQFVEYGGSGFNRRRPQGAISVRRGLMDTRGRSRIPLLRNRSLRLRLASCASNLAKLAFRIN